jgi:hypothetical protein
MKGKSKVKGQKSKVKSASVAAAAAASDLDSTTKPQLAHTLRIAELLTFEFCLLTFDLPFSSPSHET